MARRAARPTASPGPAELPAGFTELVAPVLGDELGAFLASLDQLPQRAVRANRAKVTAGELAGLLGRPVDPVPWCPDGLLLTDGPADGGVSLGRHPAHLAGLCYLQEPSSMAAVTALDAQTGWRVADLAAAPGGKTTQLASLVGPSGLVVANEVVAGRLGALHDNVDRWGAANVVTTSGPIDRLPVPPGGYDAVLLDAPCTGEGLWRRDPAARRHWSPAAVAGAAQRQGELLAQAAELVAEGGVLVYSTCTFNRAENEDRLVDLLATAPGWELDDLAWLGASPGLASPGVAPTGRAARFWPQRSQGEGQFVARLHRRDAVAAAWSGPADRSGDRSGDRPADRSSRPDAELRRHWEEFRAAVVPGFELDGGLLRARAGWLFALPPAAADLLDPGSRPGTGSPAGTRWVRSGAGGPGGGGPVGMGPGRAGSEGSRRARSGDGGGGSVPGLVRRPGLPLGRLRPGRFEPHPALASALRADQAAAPVSWTDGEPDLAAYLRGETVNHPGPDGWVLVAYRRWGLGWARRSRGVLKNAFPAQLRRQAAGLPTNR